jgi:hypothetical protein
MQISPREQLGEFEIAPLRQNTEENIGSKEAEIFESDSHSLPHVAAGLSYGKTHSSPAPHHAKSSENTYSLKSFSAQQPFDSTSIRRNAATQKEPEINLQNEKPSVDRKRSEQVNSSTALQIAIEDHDNGNAADHLEISSLKKNPAKFSPPLAEIAERVFSHFFSD